MKISKESLLHNYTMVSLYLFLIQKFTLILDIDVNRFELGNREYRIFESLKVLENRHKFRGRGSSMIESGPRNRFKIISVFEFCDLQCWVKTKVLFLFLNP